MLKSTKSRLISFLLVVALMFSLLFASAIPANAASEITFPGGSGESKVTATIAPSIFSATVPYVLPITVDANQNVSTADNAQIINNSNGPIKVANAVLETNDGWELVENGTDFKTVPVNSKQFTMEMQASPIAKTGIIDKTIFSSINGNDALDINYNADVAVQGEALNGVNIANVVFTVEWDKIEAPTIPESGVYTKSDGTVLLAGSAFPDTPDTGDTYEYGDYIYKYNKYCNYNNQWYVSASQNGWGVKVKNQEKSSYGEVLSAIVGKPVTVMTFAFNNCTSLATAPTIPDSVKVMKGTFWRCTFLTTAPEIPDSVEVMTSTFYGCTSLTTAPTIPDSVKDMDLTFYGCTSLTTAPTIPDSVKDMDSTFFDCTSLTTAPEIPDSVEVMTSTFGDCTSLTGTITINANPADYGSCFYNVDFAAQNLTLAGSSTMLATLGATGKNYIAA
ncbi:MAG: leucine-rich repeat protein [Acutalibacteraceae bacterium]